MAFFGRSKNKAGKHYCMKDMYKEYIEDKDKDSPYYVDYSTYVWICEEFNKGIGEYILSGGIFTMPFRMGEVSVLKRRPKILKFNNTSVDWFNTLKYNKLIRFTNDHTNNFKYRFHWGKQTCYVSNKGQYRMVMTRDLKRTLAKYIKSGEYDYFEM